jgi:hypothetical protein
VKEVLLPLIGRLSPVVCSGCASLSLSFLWKLDTGLKTIMPKHPALAAGIIAFRQEQDKMPGKPHNLL